MAAHFGTDRGSLRSFDAPLSTFKVGQSLFIRDDDLHVINEEELRDLVVDCFAQSVAISRSQRPSQRI